jgi:antirestriction protein
MMDMKGRKNMTMRIYVGTYGKYNDGSIKGAWLDLEDYSDKEDFLAACHELHKDESDPELMFQDFEGIPEGMVSESHIDAEVWEVLAMPEEDRELLTLYRENCDRDATLEDAKDRYCGTYASEADWAEEFLEESGALKEVPKSLRYCIDFEKYARDSGMLFIDHNGEVMVFHSG